MKHSLKPDQWVELYGDYLFSYTRNRISHKLDAEELVQDTFLAAYKAKDGFKGNASEKTWLTSILKRKIIDYYRKNSSKKTYSFTEMDSFFNQEGNKVGVWVDSKTPQNWGKSIDQLIENQELGQTLEHCLDKLPEKLYQPFKMKTLDDVDSKEICKILNISTSNLWVMLHRARLNLRDCLETNWYHKTTER
ncbi:putative RNA polymerase sigma factor [Flavobacteriaceae bacterium UJ101]|nr:putative RNA polymerase sigma factor [Flavobacteriaceae bacterium UJ101]